MDSNSESCPERNRLERITWNLVSALCDHTGYLVMLNGKDHAEFMATSASFKDLQREIQESCDQLLAHRAEHGC